MHQFLLLKYHVSLTNIYFFITVNLPHIQHDILHLIFSRPECFGSKEEHLYIGNCSFILFKSFVIPKIPWTVNEDRVFNNGARDIFLKTLLYKLEVIWSKFLKAFSHKFYLVLNILQKPC